LNKKLLSIITALLIALSLMPARAQHHATGYDPKADYNNDGVLDIKDVHELAHYISDNYGATNTQPPPATSTPEPSATPTATPTPHAHPTEIPATVGKCGEPMNVWHSNKWGSCFTGHEHGDAPPQWVTQHALAGNSPMPFSQTRESHTGYKGAFAKHASGAESYFIAHILSNQMARSHGDHDYQLWLRTSDGQIFYWDGLLCFARPCEAQPPLRTRDTGERPIILAQNDSGCETWYQNGLIDVEWIICGRIEHFNASITSGVGTHRTVGWFFYPTRFSGAVREAMQRDCRVGFGICRLQFRFDAREYPREGIVNPN
jgi:hypothetical protein